MPAAQRESVRFRVMLGIVSGALCAFGLSLILGWSFFLFLLHHLLITGARWWIFSLALSLPILFLIGGIAFAVRALRG